MEKLIPLRGQKEAQILFGPADNNLKIIEKELGVNLFCRGEYLKIKGKTTDVLKADEILQDLLRSIDSGKKDLPGKELIQFLRDLRRTKMRPPDLRGLTYNFSFGAKQISPRTKGQRIYVETIKKYDITFAIGPAGTGKTYLAMAEAVSALQKNQVRRIILTRPAIEAGESLGYLPGDMYEKISPYLRPLYDALYDMIDAERIERYLDSGVIEVAPLAYMRGRTLNDAFIILDEAQNCTADQMKMFLTRLGFDSKAVITGDITQSDLPGAKPLGLLQAQEILKEIEGIKFVYLTGDDVVRHELVQMIIQAYAAKQQYNE
jgi:phosphate starvation-inducible PhoH-like protein